MSRSLRPRTERPNYALLDLGDPPGAHEPATTTVAGADSDFAPDDEADALGSDEEEGPDQEIDDEGAEDAPPISRPSASAAKGKGKARASAATSTADAPNIISQFPPGFDAPRQMYQLPQPSANHRHKAVPIFYPSGATRRLVREPVLFGANETTSTNSFTNSTRVTDRLSKAIGYNVGPGPHYSLCEDRGWFKESRRDGELGDEAERRPLVYYGVKIYGEWTVLDRQNAMMYVPAELTFSCDFGPFGKQAKVTLNPLDSIALSAFSPDSQANVFYAGAPVHALDWCPIFVEDRAFCSYKYYLAVAPLSSKDHTPCVGAKVQRPAPACIQIWSLRPPAEGDPSIAAGVTRCEMVLCIESGPALDLKWCPLPSHDSLAEVSPGSPRRLGLLAGTFEDGSLSIFSVPYPEDLRQGSTNRNIPVYVRLGEPAIRIELEDAACWSFDWANSEVLAVGCTDGVVAVYDVGEALRQEHPAADILPTHYLHVHQCGVRAVSWLRAPSAFADGTSDLTGNPTVFASGGQDGLECFTDIRDPSSHTMNRTRDVVPAIPYSPYAGGPVTIDHENILKAYSASPSMLGRGHMLLEPSGPVWSVGVSDYHAQLAVGSADGTSMTTNMLRSARRGSMVPFLQHKIFQLDYNRTTGDFRMLDHFLPRELPDRSPGRLKKQSKQALGTATGAWPACIGVTRAAWNNGGGLGASGLLANATAAGLCRVDWLQGRWLKDWFPYGGVSEIRLEDGAGAMDVDDEDE